MRKGRGTADGMYVLIQNEEGERNSRRDVRPETE